MRESLRNVKGKAHLSPYAQAMTSANKPTLWQRVSRSEGTSFMQIYLDSNNRFQILRKEGTSSPVAEF